jgi:hypothetical protein
MLAELSKEIAASRSAASPRQATTVVVIFPASHEQALHPSEQVHAAPVG